MHRSIVALCLLSTSFKVVQGFLQQNSVQSHNSFSLLSFASKSHPQPQVHHHQSPNPKKKGTTTTTQLESLSASMALTAIDTFWKTSPYAAAAITCGIKGSVADLVAQKFFSTTPQLTSDEDKDDRMAAGTAGIPSSSATAERSRKVGFTSVPSTTTIRRSSTAVGMTSSSASIISSQRRRSKRNRIKADWKRNLAYTVYGSIYQGIMQEYIFNTLYPMFFGYGTDMATVAMKVTFNLLVHAPFITIPIAYIVKALLYKESFQQAFTKYWNDIRYNGLLTKFFMVWGPVQSITFSIVPEHWRVTFIAIISFFWMVILSSTASKPTHTSPVTSTGLLKVATVPLSSTSMGGLRPKLAWTRRKRRQAFPYTTWEFWRKRGLWLHLVTTRNQRHSEKTRFLSFCRRTGNLKRPGGDFRWALE